VPFLFIEGVGEKMISLNGVDIPSFVKVNKIDFSVLPPIENKFLKVRGKAGLYNLGQDVGQRVLTVGITVVAEKINGVMSASRELASWLHNTEAVEMRFADEPDKHYLVLPDGETNLTEIVNVGQGELTFVCTEPYAYGDSKEFYVNPTTTEPFFVDVGGSTETFPEIEMKMNKDVSSICLTSGDGHVLIGEPMSVEKTQVDTFPKRFEDHLENSYTWGTASQVDGGTVYGTFTSVNGWGVEQDGLDYGTNTSGWHGASGLTSLPEPVGDFEVKMWCGLSATNIDQVGRVELYLLDQNNKSMGKVALVDDYTNGEYPRFEARAGDRNSGIYFAKDYGPKRDSYKNFYGVLRIGRQGKRWYAYIGKYDATNKKFHSEMYEEWVDVQGSYATALASVQIHVGAYKDKVPTKHMYVSYVRVNEHVDASEGQAPIVAKKDDIIRIDTSRAVIYKNDVVFYEGLNPSSTFFTLKKGMNGLALTSPDADVKINYTERWL
jgi:predicted phage tail component-like protein